MCSTHIDIKMSHALKTALRKSGLLDLKGMLQKNPRSSTDVWQPAVEGIVGDKFSLQADESPVRGCSSSSSSGGGMLPGTLRWSPDCAPPRPHAGGNTHACPAPVPAV